MNRGIRITGPIKKGVYSNARMSGFASEAEILCSTRPVPVLTDGVEKGLVIIGKP
jgi:hypothetical protein